ncbi:reverse transcriptase domain-containing protein [Tanacetum coccineum]
MLRTFSFSLTGEAKIWLNEVNEGTITSWNELREAFISRYFSPARFRRLLNEIHSFHQLDHETLVDAWLRIKEMLRTGFGHGLTKGVIVQISSTILRTKLSKSLRTSNVNSDLTILLDKLNALATRINSEFLIIKKELKEMRDGRSDNQASQIYMKDDMPMCEPHEANYEDETEPIPTKPKPNIIKSNSPTASPFLKDCTVHIPYTNAKMFADDVLLNHVGDKKLKSMDGIGTRRLTKIKIKKDEMGIPKEHNKEWKLNEKAVPCNKKDYHYLWHPTEIPHLNRIIRES